MAPHLILYDGVCGLCNRLNRFVLKRDAAGRFRFAALQSPLARRALALHGQSPDDSPTMFVISDYGGGSEKVLSRADAVLFILKTLGGLWRVVAQAAGIIPRFLLNLGYNAVAKFRYRIFGKFDACPLPSPQDKAKFLDL
jgi:predicted DCC family thiol-disulfide oxidoreductase YuxK